MHGSQYLKFVLSFYAFVNTTLKKSVITLLVHSLMVMVKFAITAIPAAGPGSLGVIQAVVNDLIWGEY